MSSAFDPTATRLSQPSDFALAGQLSRPLLLPDGQVASEAVRAICCAAMHSPEGCFVLAGQTAPAPWAALFEGANDPEQPSREEDEGGPTKRLALPLVANHQLLGHLGVGGKAGGYLDEDCRRLVDLAALISGDLQTRHWLEQRKLALAVAELQVKQQSQMIDHINNSVITMDLAGFITGWNKGGERLFGYTAEEAIGRNILFLYADENEEDLPFNAFLENHGREFEVRRRKKSGDIFWASISLSLSYDDAGTPNGLIGYLVDITERLQAEAKLRLHAKIFEHNSEAIIVTDPELRIVSTNKAFTDITGYRGEEVLGRKPSLLAPCRDDARLCEEIRSAVELAGAWQGELWDYRKNGESFPVWMSLSAVRNDKGELMHHFLVFSDISERKEAEKQIYRLAYYDALTGLPNRSLLYSLVEQAISEATRHHHHGALVFIDIDRFKNINDSFGHASADLLLKEAAQRLAGALREEDMIARLSGDEFVVALFDITHREHAAVVGRKLLDTLAAPFIIDKHEVTVSASAGIAVFPEDGKDAETLLKNADVAMYRAKQQGDNQCLFYSQEMNLRSLERLKLETALRRAIERKEFELYYQPQLDLKSGRIVGAEALLRWHRPGEGMVSPALFIPIAEETNLIVPIGEWVIDTAAAQNKAWQNAGLPVVPLAVNISPRQFRLGLPQLLTETLRKHQLSHQLFEVEITEGVLMHNSETIITTMREFQESGIALSLDDFGTGYSSLSYLKRFPISNLKIDQSFVRGIPQDPNDTAIASAIIGMAKNLKLCVIAEGVETEEQLAFLRDAGCDEIQGYLFSRPVPAADFAALLVKTNGPA
jgi:diguanylate cyclase (GGDEF)-like protein/PAS domain S-box-containing protein